MPVVLPSPTTVLRLYLVLLFNTSTSHGTEHLFVKRNAIIVVKIDLQTVSTSEAESMALLLSSPTSLETIA